MGKTIAGIIALVFSCVEPWMNFWKIIGDLSLQIPERDLNRFPGINHEEIFGTIAGKNSEWILEEFI